MTEDVAYRNVWVLEFEHHGDHHSASFDHCSSVDCSDPTDRLIQDFGDYGNGGATAIPRNAISMGLSPFSYTFETSPAGERVFSMMNHELVHVIALDNSTKSDRFYHKLFCDQGVNYKPAVG